MLGFRAALYAHAYSRSLTSRRRWTRGPVDANFFLPWPKTPACSEPGICCSPSLMMCAWFSPHTGCTQCMTSCSAGPSLPPSAHPIQCEQKPSAEPRSPNFTRHGATGTPRLSRLPQRPSTRPTAHGHTRTGGILEAAGW